MSHFRTMDEAPASSQQARALQNALRNNDGSMSSFESLQTQVLQADDAAFEPDQYSRWTFLHFVASTDLPTQHWEWILENTTTRMPTITLQHETALGESVVDVFFKHRLGDLKWQSSNSRYKAKRLVTVLAICDTAVIRDVPKTIPELLELPWDETVTAHSNNVRIARTFLRDLYLLLLRMPKQNDDAFDWWTALARITPSVPTLVADWMQLYLYQTAQHNKIRALHILCRTKPLAHLPRQVPSLLSLFLTKEGANTVIPETGRLPIAEALASGWSFECVYDLWRLTTTNTTTILLKQSPLPLFLYPAMATLDHRTIEILARHKRGAFSVYCWHMSSESVRQGFLEAARSDHELVRLTSIYEILRAAPNALRKENSNAGM